MSDFGFYRLLDRVFPRSYDLKLFLVAFVGTQVPLIATATYLVASGGSPLGAILVLAAATAVGIAVTLVGLHFALKPIDAATRALERYEADREIAAVPTHFADEAGRLLRSVDTLVRTAEILIQRQERAAVIDPLTGVANRRGFREGLERVGRELRAAETCALLVVDLDHFKAVNDAHGHLVGDLVLADIGRILVDETRSGDVVARYGGEEFLIFLAGADAQSARGLAERIRAAIAGHDFSAMPGGRVTASIGVAVAPAVGFDIDDLYDRADRALYRGKHDGRNRVVFAGAAPGELVRPEDGVDWAAA